MVTVLLTGRNNEFSVGGIACIHGSLSLNDFSSGGSSLSLKSFVRLVSGVSVSESGLFGLDLSVKQTGHFSLTSTWGSIHRCSQNRRKLKREV
jgi:hypothetical protein